MSKAGKRLALLLAVLGGSYHLLFGPRATPRDASGPASAGLADLHLGPARRMAGAAADPAAASPLAAEGLAPTHADAPDVGYAVPVELPDPPAAAGAPYPAAAAARHRTRTCRMLVTAYCPCAECCGRFCDQMTASGHNVHANGSMFVAADTRMLPFGTRVSVPGYCQGQPVPVLDRGSKVKGMRLDVFFLSHRQAKRWGARWLDVTVYLD